MRLPFRIVRRGAPIPGWLEAIEFERPNGTHKMGTTAIVYGRNGAFIVRPLWKMGPCMFHVDAKGGGVTIVGISPHGGSGGVIFDCRPFLLFPWFFKVFA